MELARAYRSPAVGVRELYVADLDAIAGAPRQDALLASLVAAGAPLWVDAAVGSAPGAREIVALGAARVVVGLETLGRMSDIEAISRALGGPERVAFSLDLRDGVPLFCGSFAPYHATPVELAVAGAAGGAGTVIVLDLARVGSGRGLDVSLLEALRRALPARCGLVAAGGVRDRRDLVRVAEAGCDAVLVASALLDGRLSADDVEGARLLARN
jgi:phosphoribosylformimino-5-aminoimidazole carboxamide ribotide isomerase